MFKKIRNIIYLVMLCSYGLAQVAESDSIQEEVVPETLSDDEVYFSIEPAYSYRELSNNPKYLTGNAEDFENEESVVLTSFTLGLRKSFHKNLFFDLGVGFSQNGEFFNFETSDSLFEYNNKYRHISFPFQLAFTTGEKVSFFIGLGLRPQALISLKRELRFTTSFTSFIEDEEEVTREGLNLFVLDAGLSMGVRVPLGDNAGIHLLALGNYQLNNTYDSMSNIIRKAYRLGGAIGFYFKLE